MVKNEQEQVSSNFGQGSGNSQVNQLETIAEQWLENSRMRVKESSYIKYRNLLQNHILPCMGKTDVAELTTEYIGILSGRRSLRAEETEPAGCQRKA